MQLMKRINSFVSFVVMVQIPPQEYSTWYATVWYHNLFLIMQFLYIPVQFSQLNIAKGITVIIMDQL